MLWAALLSGPSPSCIEGLVLWGLQFTPRVAIARSAAGSATPLLLAVPVSAALLLLGCAGPRSGADAGEGCRNQVTSFDSSGNAFLGTAGAAGGRRTEAGQMPRGTVATDFSRNAGSGAGLRLERLR